MNSQPLSKKQAIIADAGLYTLASVLTQAITLFAGILTRLFLGPVQMGVWSLLQILLVYSAYTALGVFESVTREIPFYYGKGEPERGDEIKDLVFSFGMLTAGLFAGGVVLYAWWSRGTIGTEYFYGLLLVALLILLQRLNNTYIALLRGYKHFALAGKQMIWSALVNGVLVAYFSWRWRLYGFMWAMVFSFLFNIFYIAAHQNFSFHWKLSASKVGGLIQYGFPLMVVGLLSTVFLTIDKLMIAGMIGVRELGIYSVAILSYTYIGNLPTAIGIVLIPNFHQKFGESQRVEDLKGYLTQSSRVFSDVMIPVVALAWIFMPFFVRTVLKDFEGSIEPMRVLILSGYFLALLHPHSYFLAVIRKQIWLLPVLLGACLLAVACNFFTIRSGWGLVGVSAATTFVLFMKFTATYVLASRHLFRPHEYWRDYAVSVFKFVFMAAALAGLRFLWPSAERSFGLTLLQAALFTVLYAPFLWKLNKDFEIVTVLKKKFANRLLPQSGIAEAEGS